MQNNLVSGNNLIKNQGVNVLIEWSSGYNTENRGTAVIAAGRTSVSLEHELVSTPTHASLTPKDNLKQKPLVHRQQHPHNYSPKFC